MPILTKKACEMLRAELNSIIGPDTRILIFSITICFIIEFIIMYMCISNGIIKL